MKISHVIRGEVKHDDDHHHPVLMVQNNTKAMQNRIEEVESENESLKHEIDEKTPELVRALAGSRQ